MMWHKPAVAIVAAAALVSGVLSVSSVNGSSSVTFSSATVKGYTVTTTFTGALSPCCNMCFGFTVFDQTTNRSLGQQNAYVDSQDSTKVDIILQSSPPAADVVVISYSSGNVVSSAGGLISTFSNKPVANLNTTSPVIFSSATFTGYTVAAVFTGPLSSCGNMCFGFTAYDQTTNQYLGQQNAYVDSQDPTKVDFVLETAPATGDILLLSYAFGTLTDSSSNPIAAFSNQPVSNSGVGSPTTPPTPTSTSILVPTATPTPTVPPSSTPTSTVGAGATFTPTATPVPSPAPTPPSGMSTPTNTPVSGQTLTSPTETPTLAQTVPTVTPTPASSATSASTLPATSVTTAAPTATPTVPSNAPIPSRASIRIDGVRVQISPKPDWSKHARGMSTVRARQRASLAIYVHVETLPARARLDFRWVVKRGAALMAHHGRHIDLRAGQTGHYFVHWEHSFSQTGTYKVTSAVRLMGTTKSRDLRLRVRR
jgi:hypothetical protein